MVVLVQFGQMETLQKDFVEDKIVKGKMENTLGGLNVAFGMAILVNQSLLQVNVLNTVFMPLMVTLSYQESPKKSC